MGFGRPQSQLDRYGYFGVLNSPNIIRNWKFSARPEQSEAVGDKDHSQEGQSVPKIDPLHKPAVPGRCEDEELESFLSSKPLARWMTQVPDRPDGRYLSIEGDVFNNSR